MMDGVYCVYLGGIRGICGGIAVRIYNNRERAMLNSNMSMEEFYEQVIEDFGSRLFNKFNNKEQGFDPDRIDQIKNVLLPHHRSSSSRRCRTPPCSSRTPSR